MKKYKNVRGKWAKIDPWRQTEIKNYSVYTKRIQLTQLIQEHILNNHHRKRSDISDYDLT